jgi:hypothetical protein
MNTTRLVLLTLAVSSLAIVAASNVLNTAAPAFADKTSGQQGVDKADEAIHNAPPQADENFHEGSCNGGFGAGGFKC